MPNIVHPPCSLDSCEYKGSLTELLHGAPSRAHTVHDTSCDMHSAEARDMLFPHERGFARWHVPGRRCQAPCQEMKVFRLTPLPPHTK